ncbi:UDP-glucose 4-epimerase [Hoeflea marina]|uniref:UDP-glucose 4-epimerase n=1 Tax=Hoeflea marina TaxID=274592 RepID=A0A317PP88_9HYPH|nr:NAD-dependent epimerase/dehydratase family protein [Hoeflea marina]PWW00321.1 UDP-glucose 4-epimerase [Hoeflea marina]
MTEISPHARKLRILLTGATGFIGAAAATALRADGHAVTGVSRRSDAPDLVRADVRQEAGWDRALAGVDMVVHLAAWNPPRWRRPRPELHASITRDGAIRLARLATAAGVGRFVFLSSARVYGLPEPGQPPFRETDPPAPCDAYGRAKAEAEAGIAKVAAGSSMHLLILRPPVVYGRGRLGSVGGVALAAGRGWPLPLPPGKPAKSLLALDNLTDCLRAVAGGEIDVDGIFNIADPGASSLTAVADAVARAGGRPAARRLPDWLSGPLLRCLLPGNAARHLAAPVVLDTGRLRAATRWRPPLTTDAALRAAFS